MVSLSYVSSVTSPFTKEELLDLMAHSQDRNRRLEITGMLLYKDKTFLQVLEGPDASVRKLFASIRRDLRHHGVITLFEGPITERHFPNWTMGFRDLTDMEADELPGYLNFLCEEPVGSVFPLDPARAHQLLLTFAR